LEKSALRFSSLMEVSCPTGVAQQARIVARRARALRLLEKGESG
jgi:hypothetical protein